MLDQIKLLTSILVSIHSVSGEHNSLQLALDVALQELGEENISRTLFNSKGLPSVLAYNQAKQPKECRVILNGHLDVTPGPKEFFHTSENNGKLFGKGMYDMKAAAAVLILLFKELAPQVSYPLGLQLVTDEEVGGHNGTKYQLTEGVRTKFAISGDATDFKIVNQSKGIYWIKIHTSGKSNHSAYPWLGESAVMKMQKFLDTLEGSFPNPSTDMWTTTPNVAKIETSNNTFNEIPSDCTAWLDIRFIPEERESSLQKLISLLPEDFTYEELLNEPSAYVSPDNSHVLALQKSVKATTGKTPQITQHHGGSDARMYTGKDMLAIEFGPQGGRLPDGNEWVSIESLVEYYESLKAFLLSLS